MEQFAEGLALVSLHNKVGFINKKGEVVIPLEYDNGCSFLKDWLLFALKASRPSGDT